MADSIPTHRAVRRDSRFLITWQVWLALLAAALTATGCGEKPTTASTLDAPTVGTPTPSVFFPKQAPVNGERAVPTALLFGELVVVDGCLRVNDRDSATSYLVVWPPNVVLSTVNDVVEIRNEAGQVLARVGDQVRLDGGEVARSVAAQLSKQQSLACSGPYWLVGEAIGPA